MGLQTLLVKNTPVIGDDGIGMVDNSLQGLSLKSDELAFRFPRIPAD
jgi:hypothetical protein